MEKIKVKALKTYEENNVIDKELKIIPKDGTEIEVSKGRLKYLLGSNEYKKAFVEKIKNNKGNNEQAVTNDEIQNE